MPLLRRLSSIALLVSFALAACRPEGRLPESNGGSGEASAQEAALEAAGGSRLGGSVTVLGTWEGGELEDFLAMVRPFQEATGVSVLFQGTRDISAVLSRRIRGENPPDLVGLPGPGQLVEFARQDRLIDLGTILDMDALQRQYDQEWLQLSSVDGRLSGLFIRASLKGLVWYRPSVWQQQGFAVPETWEELVELSERMADSRTAPWCLGLESGAASGWPGTDWIENILLRQSGPQDYQSWYRGELAWTSPEVRGAWEAWGRIAADREMLYGGRVTALTTNFAVAGDPLFTDPPGCYMYQQASFITDFFVANNADIQPGEDFDFFVLPQFAEEQSAALGVAGDLFAMVNDTPQSRALLRYLSTPQAQQIWVRHGSAISPNRDVPLSSYPDPLSRRMAELLRNAQELRFDASDLMPQILNNSFWSAVQSYVAAPEELDEILEDLERVRQDVYR